jgi:hypothetical protein
MAEPITLQTLLTYLTLISVPVGVFYHIMTLRNTKKNQELQLETRQAQLFMQITNKWSDVEFKRIARGILDWEWDDYDDYKRKYIDDKENMLLWTSLGTYLEGIGILVVRGLVDIGLVDDLFSAYIISYWEKFESIELEVRERFNVPQSGEWVEYLYREVKKITLDQHPELKEKDIHFP